MSEGFSDKARAEFLSEAEDIIEDLNGSLMELDQISDGAPPPPDTINGMFRGAHSLKGLCGMFGFENLAEVSHRLEDLLDQLRLGKIPFNQDLYAILFDSFERLHRAIAEISKGQDEGEMDFAPSIGRIQRFIATRTGAEAHDDPLKGLNLDPGVLNVLSEYEEHRLKENLNTGKILYRVSASFSMMEFGEKLGELTEKIKGAGEVVSTLPNSDSGSIDEIRFDIIVGSELDADSFHRVVPGDYDLEVLNKEPESSQATTDVPEDSADSIQDSIRGISRSVKVDIGRLDYIMNIVGELVLVRSSLDRICEEMKQEKGLNRYHVFIYKQSKLLDRKLRELRFRMMDVRMVPLRQVFDKLNRVVRRLNGDLDKNVVLSIKGADTELDKLLVDELAEPLMHMIRNSMDHGIESPAERAELGKPEQGSIYLNAYQKGNHVVIEIGDDGRGLNLPRILEKARAKGLIAEDEELKQDDIQNLIFDPGLSTADEISSTSGRGVGMDVVKSNIARMGGVIDLQTDPGLGTRFFITLPITLAIIQALFVEVHAERFAIPLSGIVESVAVTPADIQSVDGRDVLSLRGNTLPVFDLESYYFGKTDRKDNTNLYVVVISLAERRVGLLVNQLHGQQDVVIKPFTAYQGKLSGFSGATETGDEKPVLVFDVPALIEMAYHSRGGSDV